MLPLHQAFEKVARNFPEKICMQHKTKTTLTQYTYNDIYTSTIKVSKWLIKTGVKKGDKVALVIENCPQWGICYFAILFCAATAVPIDIQSSWPEVEYFLKNSGAKIVFASNSLPYLKNLEKSSFIKKIVSIGKTRLLKKVIPFTEITSTDSGEITLPQVNDEKIASLIYTSGTTATPKGVMLSHKNFYSNFLSLSKLNIIKPDDNVLSILPLHHSYAFLVSLIVPLLSNIRITYIDTLRPPELIKCMREEKITIIIVVPHILSFFYRGLNERLKPFNLFLKPATGFSWLAKKRLNLNLSKLLFYKIHSHLGKNLRFFVCGGAKLDKDIALFFFKLGFTILEGYGLTETSPVVTLNPIIQPRIGSVGKPIPDVKVKIANPDNEGIGQILIKGPNVMKGYYLQENETAKTIQQGWLYSGDLGCADKEGYIYLKGRIKETIVLRSGKNISPEEVEETYLSSPFIKEICVLADEKEEKLNALVVPDLDYFKKRGETNVYDIIKWNLEYLSQKLPSYKRTRDFTIINQNLPRTHLGKIQRYKINDLYKKTKEKRLYKKEAEAKPILSPVAKQILNTLKHAKNVKDIYLNDHLELDLGLDSLERIELMLLLEKKLNLTIKEEDFSRIFTVQELITAIENLLPPERIIPEKEEQFFWESVLSSPPAPRLRKNIDLTPGIFAKLFTFIASSSTNIIFRIFFNLKVYGKPTLIKEKIIICANHTSYLDGFAIDASLPFHLKHNFFFLGLSNYFEKPIIRNFIKYLKVVPVDYSTNLIETMKVSSYLLRNKKILCVFPEGSRSINGNIKEFKKGIGILAKELNMKIVPVYIQGTYQAWKSTALLPRPYPVKVIFGRPFALKELLEEGKKINKDAADYEAISLAIRKEVIKLKEKLEKGDTND
jgi:long-chain acyl-CoA synthetase